VFLSCGLYPAGPQRYAKMAGVSDGVMSRRMNGMGELNR
jgi:hypothetical protein